MPDNLNEQIHMSPFNQDYTEAKKIEDGKWVPFRICENAFRRLRLTLRYCAFCGVGACEGEHMNFSGRGPGRCVQCGPKAADFSGN